MQAGLVSKLFIWRDLFTARDLSPRLVALVRVSVTVKPTESDTAALPAFSSPLAQRKGCLINSERSKHPSFQRDHRS